MPDIRTSRKAWGVGLFLRAIITDYTGQINTTRAQTTIPGEKVAFIKM
jgi:hypothetical protein